MLRYANCVSWRINFYISPGVFLPPECQRFTWLNHINFEEVSTDISHFVKNMKSGAIFYQSKCYCPIFFAYRRYWFEDETVTFSISWMSYRKWMLIFVLTLNSRGSSFLSIYHCFRVSWISAAQMRTHNTVSALRIDWLSQCYLFT